MFIRPLRLWQLTVISLLLLALVWLVAPHQLAVVAYKLCLVALAGLAGYWLDRLLFPYARPHASMPRAGSGRDPTLAVGCMIRRAVIVGAAMLAVATGL